MRFVPLALLCVTVCYCRYYEGQVPQQREESQSKGYPQQDMNSQQVMQIPKLPPPKQRCTGPPVLRGGVKCKARIERYTYDEHRRECVPFFHGECKASGNNFKTLQECQQRCMKRRPYYRS
ncbi:Kunitz/Bovine pancreatic trypsin inhibitor domain protein [Ancylostoma ceylanicum]|uniref:Kunitz/Bovine pancreatic trypsin inhibitor domain protein n=1 Tax=Ancylostoma ceylanicum TaxID=53326 RepID=A0A0D6L8G8_9BILA|nr:Kunitz/Bovine pancreatic trypsin inhibitor domain protein [Ancylostoma ceylanicum]